MNVKVKLGPAEIQMIPYRTSDAILINCDIEEMNAKGFTLDCGQHDLEITGFYAVFREAGDFDAIVTPNWMKAGHGKTLLEAVQMAKKIALKEPVEIPLPTEF